MSTFELYLLLTLPEVATTLGVIGGFAAVFSLIGVIIRLVAGMESDDDEAAAFVRTAGRFLRWSIPIAVIGITLGVALPSQQTVLALVAFDMGSSIEGIDQLPQEAADYLRALLRDETAKLTEAD